jgi:hypothetical protein
LPRDRIEPKALVCDKADERLTSVANSLGTEVCKNVVPPLGEQAKKSLENSTLGLVYISGRLKPSTLSDISIKTL